MIQRLIKIYGIDIFIKIVDEMKNLYVVAPFEYHQDYSTYKLQFSFEDLSSFYDDNKKHLSITAMYVNAKGNWLIKIQDESFTKLCKTIKMWNDKHRIEQ